MKVNYDNNPVILNNFLNYLQGIKGYSNETIKSYNLALLQFFKFLKKYLNIKTNVKDFSILILLQVEEYHIRAFLTYLNFYRNNSPNTRQQKLCAIRRFYKWLLSTNPTITKVNPTKEIPNIERVVILPKYLKLREAKKIQNIFTIKNTKFPIRNNTIITLFLSTGIRASELINIDLKDINFNNNSIFIKGKGNKERTVYFSEKCKKQLLKYINIRTRNKKIVDLDEALFISYQKKRIGIDGIENICAKAYRLMGLQDYGYTTHTLRHTAATMLYMYTKQDILLLKKFLGHSQITSTEIYTHIYSEKIKEAIDNNPLNVLPQKKIA